MVATWPKKTSPVEPSRVIISPSLTSVSPTLNILASAITIASPHPETQHLPIPRATTAA